MTTYIGLLRAVNVGGANKVEMTALTDLLSGLGLEDVRTLLQSGNVVFRGDGATTGELEMRLETEVQKSLGLRTDFFIRTSFEWREIIGRNPFPAEAEKDPSHLVVTVLKKAPKPSAWDALDAAIRGPEKVHRWGCQAYVAYPNGIGRSKLTTALIEGKLGTRCTSRNWNTVLKLGQMASGSPQA
jgi:uncharacterized protein (DUF1697 family)